MTATGKITVLGAREFQRQLFGRATEVLDQYYLALIGNEAPNVFNNGEELNEPWVTDNGYKRVAMPNNLAWWTENSASSITNAVDVVFEPALLPWGAIKYWALCNADMGGEVYMIGGLSTPLSVDPLDRVIIRAGSMHVSIAVLFQDL